MRPRRKLRNGRNRVGLEDVHSFDKTSGSSTQAQEELLKARAMEDGCVVTKTYHLVVFARVSSQKQVSAEEGVGRPRSISFSRISPRASVAQSLMLGTLEFRPAINCFNKFCRQGNFLLMTHGKAVRGWCSSISARRGKSVATIRRFKTATVGSTAPSASPKARTLGARTSTGNSKGSLVIVISSSSTISRASGSGRNRL